MVPRALPLLDGSISMARVVVAFAASLAGSAAPVGSPVGVTPSSRQRRTVAGLAWNEILTSLSVRPLPLREMSNRVAEGFHGQAMSSVESVATWTLPPPLRVSGCQVFAGL